MNFLHNNVHLIWKSFQAGNVEAFAHFYNIHVEGLFRYGTKFTNDDDLVKDAIQEVFLDLYVNRKKNKTNPENLQYYLILALKRRLIRKIIQNRKFVTEEDLAENLFNPEYSIETAIIENEKDHEISRKLVNSLNRLPAKQKEALYLRYNESLEYKEIAAVLNISVESVRKQVYRALKTIREMLGKEGVLFLLFFKNR